MVGMRDIAIGLKGTLEGLKKPSSFLPTLWGFTSNRLGRMVRTPVVPVASAMLRPIADSLARRVARFGRAVDWTLMTHREAVLDRQYVQERIADAAIALMTSACTLSRWDLAITKGQATPAERTAAELYLRMANRRFDEALKALTHNDDRSTTEAALAALETWSDYRASR
jgi:hypothetical protein